MDQTGCPEGLASDHVMLYGSDFIAGSCEVSIKFYIAYFACLCVFRGAISVLQFKLWLHRERSLRQKYGRNRKRLPIVPLLSLITSISLVLFVTLTSTNVANGGNGIPGFLLGMFYLPLALESIMILIKMVRVGKNLIPLSKLGMSGNNSNHTPDAVERELANLSRATSVLRVIFSSYILVTFTTPISFFVGLFVPSYVTFQIGALGYAFQDLFLASGYCYQYERVIRAIRACRIKQIASAVQNGQGAGGGSARDSKIDDALRRLRIHQLVVSALAPVTAIVWILAASRAVLPHYWMVMIFFTIELLVMLPLTLSYVPKSWFPTRRNHHISHEETSSKTNNKNIGVAVSVPCGIVDVGSLPGADTKMQTVVTSATAVPLPHVGS